MGITIPVPADAAGQRLDQSLTAQIPDTGRAWLAQRSAIWTFAIERSAEHYGQPVGYYRANNMVAADSRR